MRRQTPIAHLLYTHLFPTPSPKDPPTFSAHLAQNLVPEVRIEVATFYGDLNSTEARYPGLNYCYPPHRMRLGRFKHHAKLFRVFDELALSYQEVQDFCCWEGTKWARERFERDEGVRVVDTTGDEIGEFVDRRVRKREEANRSRGDSILRKTEIDVCVERSAVDVEDEEDAEMSDDGSEASDDTASAPEPTAEMEAREAHMTLLQQRRDSSISARILAAWEEGRQLPPELEQYLKEQSERSGSVRDMDLIAFLSSRRRSVTVAAERSVAVRRTPVTATAAAEHC